MRFIPGNCDSPMCYGHEYGLIRINLNTCKVILCEGVRPSILMKCSPPPHLPPVALKEGKTPVHQARNCSVSISSQSAKCRHGPDSLSICVINRLRGPVVAAFGLCQLVKAINLD